MRVTDNGLFPPFEGESLTLASNKKNEGGKHPFLIFFLNSHIIKFPWINMVSGLERSLIGLLPLACGR